MLNAYRLSALIQTLRKKVVDQLVYFLFAGSNSHGGIDLCYPLRLHRYDALSSRGVKLIHSETKKVYSKAMAYFMQR